MSKKDVALRLALDYLLSKKIGAHIIATLREALAEQPAQQEPVGEAYLCDKCQTPFDGAYYCPECGHNTATKEPVYTSPPAQRTWVGLTDEEVDEWTPEIHSVIRAIEAKLREKNT